MNQPSDDIAICRSGKVLVTAKYTDIIASIEKGLLRITRLENGCIKAERGGLNTLPSLFALGGVLPELEILFL